MHRPPELTTRAARPLRLAGACAGFTLARALALAIVAGSVTVALAVDASWNGRIVDGQGVPLEGYRVVARLVGAVDVRVSEPSDAAGRYRLLVPAAHGFEVIALYDPAGRRVEIDPVRPDASATSERWLDVRYPSAVPRSAAAAGREAARARETTGAPEATVSPRQAPAATGDEAMMREETAMPAARRSRRPAVRGATLDRLLLGWVQEPIVANRQHWEVQIERADFDIAERLAVAAIGAWRTPWFRRVELGGRVGFAGNDETTGARDGSGLTDTELWIKGALGDRDAANPVIGWGGTVVLPTGDGAEARGEDALGLSGFGSVRVVLRSDLRLTGYAGLGWTEDGQLGGARLEGRFAPFAGGGAVLPLRDRLSAVGEVRWSERRYDELDADLRVLGGVNWRALQVGVARFALGIGLDDGAPDWQVIAGYAFDY